MRSVRIKMLTSEHVCRITIISFVCVIYSTFVVDIAGMDFKSALEIVRSQSVVMDIKEHEMPGTKQLVNEGLDESQMSAMEANHSEAVRVALEGIEQLSRTLTGSDIYRRADGLGNNIQYPRWGATLQPQSRLLPNSYRDGKGLPRTIAKSGNLLASARTVSLRCFLPSREERPFFDRETSQLSFQLGQFVDHDVIATSLEVAFGCCSSSKRKVNISSEEPCFTIDIEQGDRFFHGNCMNFRRAYGVTVKGVREQLNTATSLLDISTVYGSNGDEVSNMRQFRGGLLKVTGDNMLPMKKFFPCVKRHIPQCPVSGDSRVNEIAGLSAIHLVFHREHNRIARKLAQVNPHWNDETLFQESRKINCAQYQRIIYHEFLPKVIGTDVMKVMGIDKPYRYNPQINPTVINEFGVAAFRFGHTLLSGIQYFKRDVTRNLSELFFRPESVLYQGEFVLRDVIQNQARKLAHKFDSFFTTEITDKLYLGVDTEAEPGESFDLLARNIQRGRDHGVAPYVDYLEYCLKRLQGIDGITELNLPACLKTGVYESINDVDIFTGGVYETPLAGALVGPTFACIIGEQFYRLKFGDRYFFETPDRTIGFKPGQLAEIKKTATLSAMICRNTVTKYMQPRALDSRRAKENQKLPCSSYPDIDFTLWKQPRY